MAYLRIKSGVTPRLLVIAAAIANVAQTLQEPNDVTITSGTDGKHMKGSKHHIGAALDVRTKNFPSAAAKRHFINAVLQRLGKGYQGILEHEGRANEHAHIEWDPDA